MQTVNQMRTNTPPSGIMCQDYKGYAIDWIPRHSAYIIRYGTCHRMTFDYTFDTLEKAMVFIDIKIAERN